MGQFCKKTMARKKKIENNNEHIYKSGEDLGKIAKKLTGKSYKVFALLTANGYSLENLPDGAVLKWEK